MDLKQEYIVGTTRLKNSAIHCIPGGKDDLKRHKLQKSRENDIY